MSCCTDDDEARRTHLEYIEDDVELDRVLAAHAVVHLAHVGGVQEYDGRDDQEQRFHNYLNLRDVRQTSACGVSSARVQ